MARGFKSSLLYKVPSTNNQQSWIRPGRESRAPSACSYSLVALDLVRVGSVTRNWYLCHPFFLPYFLNTVNSENIHWGLSKKMSKSNQHTSLPTIINQQNRVISSPRLVFGIFSRRAINGGGIVWKKKKLS